MNRFDEALKSQSRSNPAAILNSMKRAIDEIRASGKPSTPELLEDPALRLMVYRLARIFKVEGADPLAAKLLQLELDCQEMSKRSAPSAEAVGMRIGVAKGRFFVPGNIDGDNSVIFKLFTGDTNDK